MNRRIFLRSMLGAGAGLALPSEVWPFRKIFLPPVWPFTRECLPEAIFPQSWTQREAAVYALELENIAQEIPQLLVNETVLWNLIKKRAPLDVEFRADFSIDQPVADAANQVLRIVHQDIRNAVNSIQKRT